MSLTYRENNFPLPIPKEGENEIGTISLIDGKLWYNKTVSFLRFSG